MSSEAAIAIVGILTSGVLGPSAAAWWAARRQAQDHQQAFAKELREALDEAAEGLARSRRTNHWVVRLWRKGLPGDDPRIAEANAEQRLAVERSRVASARLTLRLGPTHPLVGQFTEAHEVLDGLVILVQDHASAEPIDAYVDRINELGRRYTEKSETFLAAAHGAVKDLSSP